MPDFRFDFDFDPRFRLPLALAGITPSTTAAYLRDGHFEVRFGAWTLRTPISNITSAELAGPFRWVRAVGVRLSLTDRGVTFGTTARRGVCLTFRTPVPGIEPLGVLRHPGATVTVREPEALMLAMRAAGVALGKGAPAG
ncbi:MAG: hypothetical protein ABJC62_02155 [Frankiaceae bacterium]